MPQCQTCNNAYDNHQLCWLVDAVERVADDIEVLTDLLTQGGEVEAPDEADEADSE